MRAGRIRSRTAAIVAARSRQAGCPARTSAGTSARSTRSAMAALEALWGVVLAGGEGVRLRPLVRRLLGEERPKQFVKLLGPRSLLRQTLDRVGARHLAGPHRRGHGAPARRTTSPRSSGAPRSRPTSWSSRKTGAPRPRSCTPRSGSPGAIRTRRSRSSRPITSSWARPPSWPTSRRWRARSSGIRIGSCSWAASPRRPRASTAGSSPARPIDGDNGVVSRVRRFWEKPPEAAVQTCLAAGCLWNTAIAVARARALMELGARALPEMSSRLAGIRAASSTRTGKWRRCRRPMPACPARASRGPCSSRIPSTSASRRLPRVTWCDLGSPRRVLYVLARMRVRPAWADLMDAPTPRRARGRRPPTEPSTPCPPRSGPAASASGSSTSRCPW